MALTAAWNGVPALYPGAIIRQEKVSRALRMTPAQLSAMLSGGTVSGSMVDDNNEQEENGYEE